MLAEKDAKRTDDIRDIIFASFSILACLLVLAWQYCALRYWVPDVREMGTVFPLTREELARLDRFETWTCFVPALFFLVLTILGCLQSISYLKNKRLGIGIAWIATVVLALFGVVFSAKVWCEGMVF